MHEQLNNHPTLQPLRRTLRKNSTPQEVIIWSKLRREQLGVRFRRQHSIGNFILDFYCTSCRLAIEIDGSQHVDNEIADQKRTESLEKFGIRVLRFGNNEVNTNLEGVLLAITSALDTPSQPPP